MKIVDLMNIFSKNHFDVWKLLVECYLNVFPSIICLILRMNYNFFKFM